MKWLPWVQEVSRFSAPPCFHWSLLVSKIQGSRSFPPLYSTTGPSLGPAVVPRGELRRGAMLASSISVCQHIATDVRSTTCGIEEHNYPANEHSGHRKQNTEHNNPSGQNTIAISYRPHSVGNERAPISITCHGRIMKSFYWLQEKILQLPKDIRFCKVCQYVLDLLNITGLFLIFEIY